MHIKLKFSCAQLIGIGRTAHYINGQCNFLLSKAGIHFSIEVNKPSEGGEWSCALKFDGNDKNAELNQDLCLFLERYADEIEETSDTPLAKAHFDHWFDTELAYYAGIMLKNKSDDIG